MLLVARPILGGFGVGVVIEAASALASVSAAAGAGLGDVVPILVIVVEALGRLLPRGGAAPASGRGGEVALVVVVEVVDLGGVEVRGEVPGAAKGEGGEPGGGLSWGRRGIGGGGVRVVRIHGCPLGFPSTKFPSCQCPSFCSSPRPRKEGTLAGRPASMGWDGMGSDHQKMYLV